MPHVPSPQCPDEQDRVMNCSLRYTTQKEPALSASFLAAVLPGYRRRYFGLTDEDLAILGPVMLIVAGVVIRGGVFAPTRSGTSSIPRNRTSRDRAPLPWLPACHVRPRALRRLRGRDDHAAGVRQRLASTSSAALAAASGLRVEARGRPPALRTPCDHVDHVVPKVHGGTSPMPCTSTAPWARR